MKAKRFFLYVAGHCLLPFGIVLSVKADFGISVATSATYVLSLIVDSISFGTFNYLYQGAVFILMLIIIREVKLKFFLSFLTAVVFGYGIDLWSFLLRNFNPDTIALRLPVFIGSLLAMVLAIALFIKSGLPLLPFDIFVRKVSAKYGISFGRFKLFFDLANLLIAVVLSFLFLGRLTAVSWGTFVYGFTLGPMIGFCLRVMNRSVRQPG